MKKFAQSVLFSVCLASGVASAVADEVEEAVKEGMDAYHSGDFTTATSQLDYAATLIRQKKAEQVTDVFPAPLSGWTAKKTESNAAGGMMMGGGITASREYYKGNARVHVQLVTDSPMMQSMMMLFNNPSMIAMSGGKLIKVQGNKAMLKQEGDHVTVTLIVNGNSMFTIEGSGGATAADVTAYANKLKLAALN